MLIAILLLLRAFASSSGANEIPLRLIAEDAKDVRLSISSDGEATITTTGGDPYVMTVPIGQAVDADKTHVLAFDYFCASGLDSFEVFLAPGISPERKVIGEALPVSETWSPYSIDLKGNAKQWRKGADYFRLDFGRKEGRTIRVRNLHLRAPTDDELRRALGREEDERRELAVEKRIFDYLDRDSPCRITSVDVGKEKVTVKIDSSLDRGISLCDIPLWAPTGDDSVLSDCWKQQLRDASFRVKIGRFIGSHDRAYSRFVIAEKTRDGWRRLSHDRYPDSIASRWNTAPERPKSPKGLGGIGDFVGLRDEYRELGIHNITVNTQLTSLLRAEPGANTKPFKFGGATCHVNMDYVARLDKLIGDATASNVVVSSVILVSNLTTTDPLLKAMGHPDCAPRGVYAMANVTTDEGVEAYAAGLAYLAERYCRPDKRYGRITHWIIHNEVDAGWVWTNAGDKTMGHYLDLYTKSLRTAWVTTRRFDAHAKVFISLTHHWTETGPKFYKPKEMLERLAQFCQREGDFEWGLAYHPYPTNLRDPRTWADKQVNFTFDTPLITFRNLEVLDAWMARDEMLYRDERRTILLSEQGINSPDYSEESLRLQAAGLVYAWQKVKSIPSIEAFHYHRYADHEKEGGLLLGLWTVKPGTVIQPDKKKPAWDVYKAFDTDAEADASAFAKEIIGVDDLNEILYRGKIE